MDYADTFTSYAYDAYGRKISETNFGGADVGFVETAKTLFVYDGWRLLEEVSVNPSDNSTHVVADDVPGPAYVDDIVANRRDLDHSGSMASDEQFYHLTDQQYSTVALLAGDGNPAERYGYDPFGAPSLYNGSGDPEYDPHNTAELTTKSDFNPNLYTGQRYLPESKLYDSRNRLYNPAQGRFLTGDPSGNFGDEANLGNGYTYVGNNPGSFVDPFGLEKEVTLGETLPYVPGELANSYIGHAVGGLISGIGWLAGQAVTPFNPAQDITNVSPSVKPEYTPENALGYISPGGGPRQDFRVLAGQENQTLKEGKSGVAGSTYNALMAAGTSRVLGTFEDGVAASLSEGVPTEGVQAFKSFRAFKRARGSAGEGNAWHHIVEQSQEGRFGAETIHNTGNIVAVPQEVNIKLNALYSSKRFGVTGSKDLTIREWLSTKSYEFAHQFGLKAIQNVVDGTWP